VEINDSVRATWAFCFSVALAWSAGIGTAKAVSIDPSHRYYQDGSGRPVFLMGYYDWAAVPDDYFIDHPSRYSVMIQKGAPYKLNYIRISLGVNRMTSLTSPQSWNNQPTPVPFAYVNGLANLDQWDATFWTGLQNQCALAQQNGVIVMISFFDGVELRSQGGASYGYNNSFWNPANQASTFYPAGDYSDSPGAFYRLSDFTNNTGIGKYQRMVIAQAISQTAGFSNVMFEVSNEPLGADANWIAAVVAYAKTLTTKPITQIGGARAGNIDGWSEHDDNTPAQAKSNAAAMVGLGVPAWGDPDGPALSDANVSSDDLRRAAWYSFAGGTAGWGGFTVDYWSFGHGFNSTTACYYRNLQSFIQDSGVQFCNMVPSHNLVSNNGTNSCLARAGEYVVYVLNDAGVNVDLSAFSGSLPYRLYDPRAGTWTTSQNVSGGGIRSFNKPVGADDWVIYIGNGNGGLAGAGCPPPPGWSILGTQQTLGAGITPGVATDSQGNIHVVYMYNGAIYYKKADRRGVFGATEQIPVPEGAANYNSPHVVCDTNGDPHVVFERDWYPSRSKCWYSNRKGGSWKPPVLAFNGLVVMYSRLVLYGTNAFVAASTVNPGGTLARFSNLSGTPQLDLTNGTYLLAPYPVIDNSGNLFVIGRNSAAGHYLQQYDLNLNAVGNGVKMSTGTPNKTGEPTAAVIDGAGLIHAIGNCGATGIDPESSSDIWYNTSQDGSGPAQGSILGLSGAGWMGQVVYPHCALDANGRIYLAYRNESTGEGKIAIVTNGQFADPVTFTEAITDPNTSEQRRWNCQLAPASGGGVYATWDYNGISYMRPVGVNVTWPPLIATPTATPTYGVAPLTVQFTGQASGGRSTVPLIDTTDDHLGTVTAAGENNGINGFWEVATNAFDDTTGTKWLDFATNYPSTRQSWIQYQYANGQGYLVTEYTITSANDAASSPERNPADWRLLGSNNGGVSWVALDVRTNQVFTANFQKLAYGFINTTTYNIYRFQIDRVANPPQAVAMQLDELEFLVVPAPYSYSWSFGDGTISTTQHPQHTYSSNGVYTATLVVSDGLSSATNALTIHVAPLLLTIAQTGAGGLNLSWPTWATSSTLYGTTNLAPPALWSAVTNSAVVVGNSYVVTLPISSTGKRYFQLR